MFKDNGTPTPIEESGTVEADPIVATQRWMEDFVIAKGVCPPFVRLSKDYRNPDGTLDWGRFSEVVVTEDATHLPSDPDMLLPFLTEKYLDFMAQAHEGKAPMALNFVLPDIEKNEYFEYLIGNLKLSAISELASTPERQTFSKELFLHAAARNNMPETSVVEIVNDGAFAIGIALTEGIFSPVYFHGQKLSRKDLEDYPDTDGPKSRYRVLARAPYYTVQFLNAIDGTHLYAQLNRQTVYKHNNKLIEGMDIPVFESEMEALREGK